MGLDSPGLDTSNYGL